MRIKETSKHEFHILRSDGNLVAGVNIGFYRPWIYPLHSSSGVNVLREFPPDHGFHNGAFFGHSPLVHEECQHNFWAAPPFRSEYDSLSHNVGRISTESTRITSGEDFGQITLYCDWLTHDGIKLCSESRTIRLYVCGDKTFCRIETSIKNVSSKSVTFEQTKFSGHAFRLSPIITSHVRTTLFINNVPSNVQEAHGSLALNRKLSIISDSVELSLTASDFCHFFVRDYGLISANPFLIQSKTLKASEIFKYFSELIVS